MNGTPKRKYQFKAHVSAHIVHALIWLCYRNRCAIDAIKVLSQVQVVGISYIGEVGAIYV